LFSPDGRTVAAAQGKRVLIYRDGKLENKLKGHKGVVSSVTWSHGGTLLASGGSDNTVILWDPNEEKAYSSTTTKHPLKRFYSIPAAIF
jgi:WD40 repeat protein